MVGGFFFSLQPALICKKGINKSSDRKIPFYCKPNMRRSKRIRNFFGLLQEFKPPFHPCLFAACPGVTLFSWRVFKSKSFISSTFYSFPALDDITWHSLSCLIFQPSCLRTPLQSSLIRTCRIQFWPISCNKFQAGGLLSKPGSPRRGDTRLCGD